MCFQALQGKGAVTVWQQVNVNKSTQLILDQESGHVTSLNTLTGLTVQVFIPVCTYGYNFHLQKYCIQIYTQLCTFLLSVCPILKTRQTTHKTEITEYSSPDSLFSVTNLEKNVGSFGAWPKMEDGRGLLSGMIESYVAYLVAVHPQIV